MKKTYLNVKSLLSTMMSALLAILGFSSCDPVDDEDGGGDYPVMYGTPTGYYEVKGAVMTEDNVPVEGAKVVLKHPESTYPVADTVKSSRDGSYLIEAAAFPGDVRILCLPDSKKLEADSVDVKPVFEDMPGSNSWTVGKARINHDFKLKKRAN